MNAISNAGRFNPEMFFSNPVYIVIFLCCMFILMTATPFVNALLVWFWSKIFKLEKKDYKTALYTSLIVTGVWMFSSGSAFFLFSSYWMDYQILIAVECWLLCFLGAVISINKLYKASVWRSFFTALAWQASIALLFVLFIISIIGVLYFIIKHKGG